MPTLPMPTMIIIGYIALELLSFSVWVNHFGFLSLFFEIIISGCIGLWLWALRTRSLSASLNDIIYFVYQGRILELLKSNMLFYLGAILLIIPGIFSDIVGIICICVSIMITPKPIDSDFRKDFRARQHNVFNENRFNARGFNSSTESNANDDIIEVEIIEESNELESKEIDKESSKQEAQKEKL